MLYEEYEERKTRGRLYSLPLDYSLTDGYRVTRPSPSGPYRLAEVVIESFGESGGLQPGKKVLATIFDACPLVTPLFGLKYGRFSESHGSNGPPHG